MACDLCKKRTNDELLSVSPTLCSYLPFKYADIKMCGDCSKKLNRELDKWRSIAWQKAALMLVDMAREGRG